MFVSWRSTPANWTLFTLIPFPVFLQTDFTEAVATRQDRILEDVTAHRTGEILLWETHTGWHVCLHLIRYRESVKKISSGLNNTTFPCQAYKRGDYLLFLSEMTSLWIFKTDTQSAYSSIVLVLMPDLKSAGCFPVCWVVFVCDSRDTQYCVTDSNVKQEVEPYWSHVE